ncbi:endonuclease [Niastella yeongjuensis]|uniref:Endonuclease n=2 Tax=Niastella yeongjuensis TaxID=354355 RepID=A0A1V9EN21_9BACT|nr:endonuclease [Niastella yeongjuensis]
MASRRRMIKRLGAVALAPFLPAMGMAAVTAVTKKDSAIHKVLTCNIRVALPEDDAIGLGWNARKEVCVQVIKKQQPDLIGFQEVLKEQAAYIQQHMPQYALFGFDGPEMDANPTGYHGIAKNPIMYLKSRYELLTAGTYWLSETPLVAGSMSWNTARARHVNWVRLKEIKTGNEFRVVNLHLDHKSPEAKVQQAKLMAMESSQYLPTFPQILTGDFNSTIASNVFEPVKAAGFADSYAAIHGDAEPGVTAHGFEPEESPRLSGKGKIDFIFCKGNCKPLAAGIIKDKPNGIFPSDHFFVQAEISLL